MRIVDVELQKVRVAREYPTITGHSDPAKGKDFSTFLILQLKTDDGLIGLGEVSDLPEDFSLTEGQVREAILDCVRDQSPFQLEAIHKRLLERFPVRESDRLIACGVEIALYDLMGKATGRPVSDLAGGTWRDEVQITWVVFIRPPGPEMEAEVAAKVREGFTAFKLKVGHDFQLDLERVKLLRNIAGDKAHIRIDPNGAWTADDALDYLRKLEPYNISGIETPTPFPDIAGKVKVRRRTDIPVLEHVRTLQYGLALLQTGAVDVFNVSTVGSRGLLPAKKIVALAEAAEIPCLLGSTVELGIGTAAQLHLAASSPAVTWASDLVGPLLYTNDIVNEGFRRQENDRLTVPKGPGLGITLNQSKVKQLRPPA